LTEEPFTTLSSAQELYLPRLLGNYDTFICCYIDASTAIVADAANYAEFDTDIIMVHFAIPHKQGSEAMQAGSWSPDEWSPPLRIAFEPYPKNV
jgi:hypothetical protein